jgi:hypothetical protein
MPSVITTGAPGNRALGQRHQRQRPAFAAIVRSHQYDDVLDADDQNQRPDDQRQYAEDDGLVGRNIRAAARCQHRFAQGVEGARADVAVNDADRAEGQRPECALRVRLRLRAVGGGNV